MIDRPESTLLLALRAAHAGGVSLYSMEQRSGFSRAGILRWIRGTTQPTARELEHVLRSIGYSVQVVATPMTSACETPATGPLVR